MNQHFERKECFATASCNVCLSVVVVCRVLPKTGSTGRITLSRRQTMTIKRHAVALFGGGGTTSLSKKVLKSAFKCN